MRSLFIRILERVSSHKWEWILARSIFRQNFKSETIKIQYFIDRGRLWASLFNQLKLQRITLLEFGVFEAYSIKKFAELNSNCESQFFGFDSFEGLPEDWTSEKKKGTFNLSGNVPDIGDERIKFVKGWFQNTLPLFLKDNYLQNAH